MSAVFGPVSSLPGSLHAAPQGQMCDTHPDRLAVRRVQGETDSMGCEMIDMCMGVELCPVEDIVKIVEDAIQSASLSNNAYLNKQLQFLRGLCAVYSDGRNCTAPDIMLNFKKLETGGWKRDRAIVLSGIVHRAVKLSDNDYLALSLTADD